jgi:hypothetical protein
MMIDHEDAYQDEQLTVGKGMIIGVVLGSLMWTAIISGLVYILK